MTFSPDEVRVDPVDQAVPVNYPWSDATAAVDALDAARSRLETEGEGRPSLIGTISEWRGVYRDDFDETYDSVVTTTQGLVELLQSVATAIANGAEDAANQQIVNNNAAVEAAEALSAPGGPGVPGPVDESGVSTGDPSQQA